MHEGLPLEHPKVYKSHLGVPVEVPQVESSGGVCGGEQCRMYGRPARLHHVVAAVLERVQGLVLLQTIYQ